MRLTLKHLVPGNESFMPTLEEDGASVSVEQTIEVETAAAEEAAEVEEVADEIQESNDDAETADEAAELYARVDHLMDVTSAYGMSQPLMALANFDNELTAIVPNLPSMESLGMVASPNDAASVIAQEGFKEAMKSFWEWVKKVARKVRDTVVNLASRVAGLFTRLDSTAKRLAKAIGEAEINDKKLGERKAKLMSKQAWMNLAGLVSASEGDLNGMADAAGKAMSGNPQNLAQTFGKFLTAFGIKVDGDSVEKAEGAKDLFKTTEDTVKAHGWGKADCSNTQSVAKIYAMARVLPQIANKIKKIASDIEAVAARAEKMTEGDASQVKKLREDARTGVKALNLVQKGVNMVSKAGFQLVREFIKAQRAVYACRGNYDEPKA